jgi:lysophospholipase L1-like esterase
MIASALLLEVVLQIGALVAWWYRPAVDAPAVGGGDTILCVGDSWVEGMGSTDPATRSWPAVLQALLRERGAQWTVANCGRSGRNSREVLELLPAHLRQYRPRIVCVLVANNDYWTLPELLPESSGADADPEAYRFRWRLPRLAAWIAGKLSPAGAGDEWAPRAIPSDCPYWRLPKPYASDVRANTLKKRGWQLEGLKDVAGARSCFEGALALVPDDAQVRWMLASLAHAAGDQNAAAMHLDWLRAAWRRDPTSYWHGTSLVTALRACTCWQECQEVAVRLLERYPDDPELWRSRCVTELQLGDLAAAKRSNDNTIRCGPVVWDWFLSFQIHCGAGDVDGAIRAVFAGYVAHNDAKEVEAALRILGESGHERAKRLAAEHPCDPAVSRRLLEIVRRVRASPRNDEVEHVLRQHVARIVRAANDAGARAVVTCYPTMHDAEPVLRTAAAEHGASFVEMRSLFEQRRGDRSWEQLRSSDGHCNDDGYRVMAEIVANQLASAGLLTK